MYVYISVSICISCAVSLALLFYVCFLLILDLIFSQYTDFGFGLLLSGNIQLYCETILFVIPLFCFLNISACGCQISS